MRKVIILFLLGIISYGIHAQSKIVTKEEFDSDSLLQERRTEFLKPAFIAKFIGTSFATKTRLENDLKLIARGFKDDMVFYDLNGSSIGIDYYKDDNTEICVGLSFRFFGQEGSDYENSLAKNGFTLSNKKKTSNLELEGDLSSQLLNGELRTYRKGEVVCEVMQGSYFSFSFYRSKLPVLQDSKTSSKSSKSSGNNIKSKKHSK